MVSHRHFMDLFFLHLLLPEMVRSLRILRKYFKNLRGGTEFRYLSAAFRNSPYFPYNIIKEENDSQASL